MAVVLWDRAGVLRKNRLKQLPTPLILCHLLSLLIQTLNVNQVVCITSKETD